MTSFEAYKLYVAISSHFTRDSYDFHKYNGKTNASVAAFEKRRDRYFFERLARQPDVQGLIVSNFAVREKLWVRDLLTEEAKATYGLWAKRLQSLSYTYKQQLSLMLPDFDANLRVPQNGHPHLLQLYARGTICLETLCILCSLTGCRSVWDKRMAGDPYWESVSTRVKKYTPFIGFDQEKMRKITVDYFFDGAHT